MPLHGRGIVYQFKTQYCLWPQNDKYIITVCFAKIAFSEI